MKNARILCVDDEPSVLEGLQRVLYKRCIVLTAVSGEEALKILAMPEHIDVIVTDMRMPRMNGAELLIECRKRSPATVRLLLTGQADLDSAISAVNDGQVFRFLTKPCAPALFLEAVAAAVERGRSAASERELLERTVTGNVRALTEVIALVHPGTLGSTSRQLERARKVSAYLQIEDPWHVEIAAILSQAGYVVLPNDIFARRNAASDGPPEANMLSRVPLVLARVLSGIPRLELAQQALKFCDRSFSSGDGGPQGQSIPIGSRILKALLDFSTEEQRTFDPAAALDVLRGRRGDYDPAVLEAIAAVCAPRTAERRSIGA